MRVMELRRRFAGALVSLALGLLPCTPAFAGKLADAGREARAASNEPSRGGSGRVSTSEECDEEHHHARGIDPLTRIFVLFLTAPWTVPNALLEPADRGTPRFEAYPYARGSSGLLRYAEPSPSVSPPASDDASDGASDDAAPVDEPPEPLPIAPGRAVAAELRAEGGYIWGGVYRGRIGARLMMPYRLELDADLNGLAEARREGGTDRATFGGGHLAVRFAQSEHVQFRTGVGYQQYADGLSVERGFDLLYGFEAELGARLILSMSGDLGTAGHAFVAQARGSLGVMLGPVEIYGGYDHVVLGGVELGGPAVGLRGWL